MKRLFQPDLMRGRVAQNASVLLWAVLLAVLVVSVVGGLQRLYSKSELQKAGMPITEPATRSGCGCIRRLPALPL